jgi:hypothetical protein
VEVRTAVVSSRRPSWICRDQPERERFLDMHARILPAHQKVLGLFALLLIPTIPFDSIYAPIPLMLAVIGYAWAQHNATRYERPELVIAAGLLVGQLMLTCAVVIDGRQHTVGVAVLIWSGSSPSTRWR